MAMAQPLRNQKRRFLGLGLGHDIREGTVATSTVIVRRQRSGNISYCEDVRNLCEQYRLKEKALSEGKLVHTHINKMGFTPDRFLGNALVEMYVKCGSLVDARRVFDDMPKRDAFPWNVMIAAYSRHGLAEEALSLFNRMQRTGFQPNQFTLASVLPVCAKLAALEHGTEIHGEIIKSGRQIDVFVESALVDMYAKCGSIEKARDVFDKMHQRDTVSWTAMIAAYAQNGQSMEAIKFFQQMQLAMEIHEKILRSGFQSDVFVESALVDMYAKCGSIKEARNVFDNMHQRNAISWTAMISGYTQNGHADEALKLFQEMPEPDAISWNAISEDA